MSVISRTVFAIHHSFIASTLHYHSRCLLVNRHCLMKNNIKFASTAKFPGLLAEVPQIKSHDDLYKYSIENPEAFWDFQAQDLVKWHKSYSSNCIMDCDMTKGQFKWFYDGQLNASVNCVDR